MLKRKTLPDLQTLREWFTVSGAGVLLWRKSPRYGITPESPAGNVANHGYLAMKFKGTNFLVHRIVYKLVNGVEPPDVLDHPNHDRLDNSDMKPATYATNNQNKSLYKTNTSGCHGVTKAKRNGKWQVNIKLEGRLVFLGYFSDMNDAIAARRAAEVKSGCYHANHGQQSTKTV